MFQSYASNSQNTDFTPLAVQGASMISVKVQFTQSINKLNAIAQQLIKPLITPARKLLSLLGVAAVLMLIVMFFKPELAEQFKDLSPFAPVEKIAEVETITPPSLAMLMATPQQLETAQTSENNLANNVADQNLLGSQKQQQLVTNWLAKRYRVASDASNMLVSAAYLTAKEIKLDPLLILSVMAIESGLNPFAESPVGAQGLMQVMSKVHQEKFEDLGGIKAALNPVANIKVGALILKNYVNRGGSVEAGLKLYVGAGAFENDAGYGARVLAEYRRLKDVSVGKRVPIYTPVQPTPAIVKPSLINVGDEVEKANNDKALSSEQKPVSQVAVL